MQGNVLGSSTVRRGEASAEPSATFLAPLIPYLLAIFPKHPGQFIGHSLKSWRRFCISTVRTTSKIISDALTFSVAIDRKGAPPHSLRHEHRDGRWYVSRGVF